MQIQASFFFFFGSKIFYLLNLFTFCLGKLPASYLMETESRITLLGGASLSMFPQ